MASSTAVELALRQLMSVLDRDFLPRIDTSDLGSKSTEAIRTCARSRSLAAFAALRIGDLAIDDAVKCVTDGSDDNGIDAIYFNKIDKTLYCIQSKIRTDGKGSIDVGESAKFLSGIRDLLNGKFDRFNKKLAAHQTIIDAALDDANTRLSAVIAYTGQDPISHHVQRVLDDFLEEQNKMNPEFATSAVWGLKDLHAHVRDYGQPKPITLDVQLKAWGRVSDPYDAYYGYVDTADVATWWQSYGARLLDKNIRYVLEGSNVNNEISRTLETNPGKFWYFNNGITALCTSVKKKPHGGSSTDAGTFTCTNVHIVNGAQTVGSIAAAHLKPGSKIITGKVGIRFLSKAYPPNSLVR
jgi:hypothetical protein